VHSVCSGKDCGNNGGSDDGGRSDSNYDSIGSSGGDGDSNGGDGDRDGGSGGDGESNGGGGNSKGGSREDSDSDGAVATAATTVVVAATKITAVTAWYGGHRQQKLKGGWGVNDGRGDGQSRFLLPLPFPPLSPSPPPSFLLLPLLVDCCL
jgi:hypothetical protein